MAPPAKHRLSPAKIPLDLNDEFEKAKRTNDHTHTEAIEESIRLYVKTTKRRARRASE